MLGFKNIVLVAMVACLVAALAGTAAQAAVISIDFNNTTNGSWVVTGNAGPLGVGNWNNTSTTNGTLTNLVDEAGSATSASITWSSSNRWTNADGNSTQDRRLAHAYLDDGSGGVNITVSNIPYAQYRVYGLVASGQSQSYTTRDFQINGSTWILDEIINGGGASAATATAYRGVRDSGGGWVEITGDGLGAQTQTGNYWLTQSLSGATLTVAGQNRSGSQRGSLTALIIQVIPGTLYWDGSTTGGSGGSSDTWDTATANWNTASDFSGTNQNWVNTENADFRGTGGTVTVSAGTIANSLIFNTAGYTLTGGDLTLNSPGAGITANASATVDSNITLGALGATQVWTAASGQTLTVGGNVNSAGHTLTIDGDGDTTISGNVTGTGGLIKNGSGTLTMSASNSNYSGGTTLNAGTTIVSGGGWFNRYGIGDGLITINSGATLQAQGTHKFGYWSPAYFVINGGTMTMTHESYVGSITMTGGSISGGELRQPSSVTTNASASTATIASNISLSGSRTFTVADGTAAVDLLLGGNIWGGGANLTKAGDGTMVSSGTITYTGTTSVNAGTYLLNGTHTGGGNYTVAAGATLGGSGVIGATSAVTVDGTLAPGGSIGTLTIAGDLVTNNGATYEWELGDGAHDLVAVGGDLTINSTLTIMLMDAGVQMVDETDTFDLFTYSGTLNLGTVVIDDSLVAGLPGWNTSNLTIGSDADSVFLTGLAVVPEPSTFLLAALGLLGLAVCGRRRRK